MTTARLLKNSKTKYEVFTKEAELSIEQISLNIKVEKPTKENKSENKKVINSPVITGSTAGLKR